MSLRRGRKRIAGGRVVACRGGWVWGVGRSPGLGESRRGGGGRSCRGRGKTARKGGEGKGEAAPEEMYGAGLADETRAELLKDAVHGDKDLPELARIFRMVRGMNAILVKGNRVRDFHGHSPNLDVDSGRTKHPQKVLVKV